MRVVQRDERGNKVTSWNEPALGPAGRRGSLDHRDSKGGRECHVAESCTYMMGQTS